MTIENATILLQPIANPVVDWFTVYALPVIVAVITGAGVSVSVVTYIFERKKFRLTALVEVMRQLHDTKHREARKVVYGTINEASFDIIGINTPTVDEELNLQGLKDICTDIVRSDFNEIGTLIHYDLLDGKIFIKEYYWMILKIWSLVKDQIYSRREKEGPTNYMVHLEEMKEKATKYAEEHHPEVFKMLGYTSSPVNAKTKTEGIS
jgi:hypothetical protein